MLHAMINWTKQRTFGEIADRAIRNILNNHPKDTTVVLDGYPDNPTTKDSTHRNRREKRRMPGS